MDFYTFKVSTCSFALSIQFTILITLFIGLSSCSTTEEESSLAIFVAKYGNTFDILIHNGLVYDGLNSKPQKIDVLVRNDTIAYLGIVDTTLINAQKLIDASEQVVSPGFIDAHAHGNPLKDPEFENFLAMGVTTICLGQDGFSPLFEDLGEWMNEVDKVKPGVNIAMFVGHSSLRQLSDVGFDSVPSSAGLDSMVVLLTQALEAGCFGMSSGLEYNPGSFAQANELIRLAKTVGSYNGLITSHIRNEDDPVLEKSIKELLQLGEYCNVNVSHMKSVYGKGTKRGEEILSLLHIATPFPYAVSADIYPYTASYTGIGILFPTWAKGPNNYSIVKVDRREELLDFLKQKVISRNGPGATLLGTPPFTGKTLLQLSQEMEKPFEEILLEIGPRGASGAYFIMDEDLQNRMLQDSLVMISSDGSPTMNHPRGYGSFAKIIENNVNTLNSFDLAEAIRKMTSLPAKVFGLQERGILRAGYKADIIVFDPQKVKAKATYENPHQLAEGFDYVIIGGELASQNGTFSLDRKGKVLKKGSSVK